MRLDEREISGASERIDDAPDLIQLRTSNRGRKPKREWPEIFPLQPRKRAKKAPLPTPTSTQTSTQTSTDTTFSIYEDEATTQAPEQSQSQSQSQATTRPKHQKQKQPWEAEYEKEKNTSNQAARDYLVNLIGSDEYPDVLKVPIVPPEVLLEKQFTLKDPLSIWREFITEKDLIYLANHTNKNALAERQKQREQRPPGLRQKQIRRWKNVTASEIGSYIGALFLLGTQGAVSLRDNWKVSEDSPLYPISRYISLTRFEQISRYFKVNEPGQTNDSLKDTEFWYKVNPLALSFRARCRANLRPGTVFAIDEQLRRNKGRWKHALQISSKADSKGVKIYSLCAGYYCYDFLFASKVTGVPEVRKFRPHDPTAKPFSTSESVVLTLIDELQKQHPERPLHLTLACDNFFTTHKLFAELKVRGIAAYGTAKAGSGMPTQHILLRDCTDKSTDYGLTCNSVYGGVNHVTFVDQKAVHMMTTAHDVKNQPPAWREASTRRNACLERSRERSGRTELPYPQLSHDYNQGMNSCDVASQVWSYYTVSRYSHWRNWWPMLWIILDASIANVLYLYRLKGFTEADLSHKDLQTMIALQLLQKPASVLRPRESTTFVMGQRPSKIPQPLHKWEKAGKTVQGHQRRGECVQCNTQAGRQGGRPIGSKTRRPLQDISTNRVRQMPRPRSSYKCGDCDVFLCRDSTCWQRYHLASDDWSSAGI